MIAKRPMRRGALLLAVPVLGAALLGTVLSFGAWPDPAASAPALAPSNPPPEIVGGPRTTALPSKGPGTHGEAAALAKVIGAYRNYRTAVATEDGELAASLLPAVLMNREACLELAKADLAKAQTDIDVDVARKIVDTLGRKP